MGRTYPVLVPRITRREFLKLAGGAAAAVPLSRLPGLRDVGRVVGSDMSPGGLTTLDQTIVKGALVRSGTKGSYYRLAYGPGERWIVREDLGRASAAPIRAAMSFVHFTDIHLVDAQSPARVEFLDRFADQQQCESFPLNSAQRPQETLTLQVLESMIRRVRSIRRGPATGAQLRFGICTGDNIDNEQFNELRWFIDLMDGGKAVSPDSGGPGYEGVQAANWGDPEYWHPDAVSDKYKEQYGFPAYPGLLESAVKAFSATGIGLPWLQTFGNHDGLMQGNSPRNEAFNAVAVGPLKFDGPPPGIDPCNPFPGLGSQWLPTRPVTADPSRRIVRRGEYIEQHFHTSGTPAGHGFSLRNRTDGTAYYVRDDVPRARLISLDTVNPGGYSDGSIGVAQFAWLEQRLIEVHSAYYDSNGNPVMTGNVDRLVVLFSHHGLRSLVNPVMTPNPDDPGSNDLPRVLADQVEALLHRFPNVVAWVSGHTHDNVIQARPDPSGRTKGFWDIGTAAHIDWTCQTRIVEVAVRGDGNISIFCTMVDHAAPADPRGAAGLLRLASIHRELAANDYQYGFGSKGPGKPEDRNVELVLPGPAWLG
jgi:metallophosphoesterase (TIGR03767 family)